MKQLVCEMCGGTDIIKKDGVFVCQNCGVKYSLEEAKKLLIEVSGKIDVSGSTVKIDQSQRLDNLISAARLSTSSKNYETAAAQWAEIQTLDPQNWEACYYSTHCKALIERIGHIGPNDSDYSALQSTINQVIKLIKTKEPDYQKRKKAFSDIQSGMDTVIKVGIEEGNRLDKIEEQGKDYNPNYIERGYWRHQMVEAGKLYCEFGKAIYLTFKPDEKYYDDARRALSTGINKIDSSNAITDYSYTSYKNLRNQIDKEKDQIAKIKADEEQRKREAEEKAKSEAFWKDHTNEKQQLLERKAELNEQIKAINSRYNKLIQPYYSALHANPYVNEHDSIHEEVRLLRQQQMSLGMFEFKKRKVLELQIEELEKTIRDKEKEVEQEKKEAASMMAALEEEKEKELQPLMNQVGRIEYSLKVGRLMTEEGASIDIHENRGHASISPDHVPEVGEVYKGVVTKVQVAGCFVRLLPTQYEGRLFYKELDPDADTDTSCQDLVSEGDTLVVKVKTPINVKGICSLKLVSK